MQDENKQNLALPLGVLGFVIGVAIVFVIAFIITGGQ